MKKKRKRGFEVISKPTGERKPKEDNFCTEIEKDNSGTNFEKKYNTAFEVFVQQKGHSFRGPYRYERAQILRRVYAQKSRTVRIFQKFNVIVQYDLTHFSRQKVHKLILSVYA